MGHGAWGVEHGGTEFGVRLSVLGRKESENLRR